MSRLKSNQEWLSEILPEGLNYPSSTIISGEGGTGKPLIGFGIVDDWLKAGGNVIFVPLQYPKTDFVRESLKKLHDLDAEDYEDSLFYVKFDLDVDNWKRTDGNRLNANLLKPETWDGIIEEGKNYFGDNGEPGTLVFASALNLLLFSPTYKQPSLDKLKEILGGNKRNSHLITVSTSAFREDIRTWEEAADTLMFSRMEEDMRLMLDLNRLDGEQISPREVEVPIKKETLKGIKEVAEGVRNKKIPKIKEI